MQCQKKITQRVQNRTAEQMVRIPVPKIIVNIGDVVPRISQERVQNRTTEQPEEITLTLVLEKIPKVSDEAKDTNDANNSLYQGNATNDKGNSGDQGNDANDESNVAESQGVPEWTREQSLALERDIKAKLAWMMDEHGNFL